MNCEFYLGYHERLEHKLRHKDAQILRIWRLLDSLPARHKMAYESLLKDACDQQFQIQLELDSLNKLFDREYQTPDTNK